jgi:ATP-dependent exoDNAse (exonuclease V) beta subunit
VGAPQVAPPAAATAPTPSAPRPEFVWAGEAAVHVGTVVHRYLQRIAEQGLDSWSPERIAAEATPVGRELELLGVEPKDLEVAAQRVVTALTRALADPQGRWVLGTHAEAHAELTLTLRAGEILEHVRLDRTFVFEGRRWIVDFKTSQHEGGSVTAFLDSEVARYAPQLERYARAIAAIDARPVQLGLYFPLLGQLRSWPAAATASRSV